MNKITTIDPKKISVPRLHGYLLAAVAPRPIALASTVDKQGRVNLSPFSFFNVFSANPPVMIFSPARRGTDNTTKHTYENVREVPEVVVNIVTYPIVQQVSLASSEYPKNVNEFAKSGLTEVPSVKVRPPRVGESPASFECKVIDVIPLGKQGGAGNLVMAEVQLIHLHSQYLDENGHLQTNKLDLVGRMGGNWYARAAGQSLFQVPKPAKPLGVGVDKLPDSIKNSKILTGNNLGKLGGLSEIPDTGAVAKWKENAQIKANLNHANPVERLHTLAQKMLEEGRVDEGFLTLLVADELIKN